MIELRGEIALVTGAGSGIGRAIAATFARAGATVHVADLELGAAETSVAAIVADGGRAVAHRLDVRDRDACNALGEHIRERDGHLDVLVNNAGVGHVGTLLTTTLEDLDRVHDVNVRGTFNVTKAFLAGMVARRRGKIVNLASIGGVVAVRDRLAYCATKFAIVGLTKCIALDHARDGIRCNAICPGRVETPFVAARLAEYADPAAARREMEATQAIGRMGTPDEIAHAALYLASDAADFVTGTTFLIDGGWSAGK
ncbi:MAG: SDR family oxidoreductase [Planctomycetes bacterium]|nr:SDR family oxidoreductase [Planctomycetota bacterium]